MAKRVWGFYLGCSFAPSHKGMPTIAADEDVHFLRRQVLTSRNVRGGIFTDLLLGGLNYQIEHHLLPSVPRANQKRAQQLVSGYCASRDIAYCQTTLTGSYIAALGHLNTLGAPLRRRPSLAETNRRSKEPATPTLLGDGCGDCTQTAAALVTAWRRGLTWAFGLI